MNRLTLIRGLSLAFVGALPLLLSVPSAAGDESRMDTLRANLKPGDRLSLRLDSGLTLRGEYDRFLIPENAVRLRVWDTEHDRFQGENVSLDGVERCVRVRTEGNMLFPVLGAGLVGGMMAWFAFTLDDGLGQDSPGTVDLVVPFTLGGMLAGTLVGALIMPTKKSQKVLWEP